MWSTLALVAVLAGGIGQADLTLANVRPTFGVLGPARAEGKVVPGDTYHLAFDIVGVKVDEDGKVRYSMGLQVSNAQGKTIFSSEPTNLEVYNTLGGNSVPATAQIHIPPDQPAGELTIKVNVTDRSSNAKAELTRKVEVGAKEFALVRLSTAADPGNHTSVAPIGAPGQSLFVHFVAVGFSRDASKKQPSIAVEMRVLDASGKPTLAKPFTGEVSKTDDERDIGIPMQFMLHLNRPGKYTVELTATDRLTRKTAKLSMPVTVVE